MLTPPSRLHVIIPLFYTSLFRVSLAGIIYLSYPSTALLISFVHVLYIHMKEVLIFPGATSGEMCDYHPIRTLPGPCGKQYCNMVLVFSISPGQARWCRLHATLSKEEDLIDRHTFHLSFCSFCSLQEFFSPYPLHSCSPRTSWYQIHQYSLLCLRSPSPTLSSSSPFSLLSSYFLSKSRDQAHLLPENRHHLIAAKVLPSVADGVAGRPPRPRRSRRAAERGVRPSSTRGR